MFLSWYLEGLMTWKLKKKEIQKEMILRFSRSIKQDFPVSERLKEYSLLELEWKEEGFSSVADS